MEKSLNPFGNSGSNNTSLSALAQADQQRAIAEVQAAMMIARTNPRNQMKAMDDILNACMRPTLAESALYEFGKGGTAVTGASIRLAEAIAQQWGNIQFGFRELHRGTDGRGVTFSEVEAFAWDVEKNTRKPIQFHVSHWRDTKKGGYKLEQERDIYELIASQAQRRVRACILSVIPGDVVEEAQKQCEITLRSKADTSPEGIKKMLEAFEQFGVTKKQIETRIQRRSESMQPAQMVGLKKIYVSLRDGMSTIQDWFEPEEDGNGKSESKTLPPLSDDEVDSLIAKYSDAVASGKKTAAQVIATLETKNSFTESQRAKLLAMGGA